MPVMILKVVRYALACRKLDPQITQITPILKTTKGNLVVTENLRNLRNLRIEPPTS
jgi:hypothetical protein